MSQLKKEDSTQITTSKITIIPARNMLVIALVSLAALGFVFWRSKATRPPDVHVAFVYDRSKSQNEGCKSIAALSEEVLANIKGRKNSVTLFATGDKQTANEPIRISLPPLPVNNRVMEGKRRAQKQSAEFVSELQTRCASLPLSGASPIFLTIKRAIEYLQNIATDKNAICWLYVQSDLEENVEQQIKKALHSSRATAGLPAPINNNNVHVVFCGYAQTKGQVTNEKGVAQKFTGARSSKSADRITQVWASLFQHPNLVTFNPFCPAGSEIASK